MRNMAIGMSIVFTWLLRLFVNTQISYSIWYLVASRPLRRLSAVFAVVRGAGVSVLKVLASTGQQTNIAGGGQDSRTAEQQDSG